MADNIEKSYAEIDKEAIEKFNRAIKHSQDRERRLHRHYEWRGNKLPPFNIEPMATERLRLEGSGMTVVERAARKQWLKDQLLAADEPRFVKELYPKNPIKRFFGAPFDAVYNLIKPFMGESAAHVLRHFGPRVLGGAALFYVAYYNVKYLPNNWQGKRGWHMYSTMPRLYPGDPGYPNVPVREPSDFFDRGFKDRQVLQNAETSTGSS